MEKIINYENIIQEYVERYKIKVVSRSKANIGWAKISGSREVKIPYCTDEISFVVCLHEIGHIVTNAPKAQNWFAEYQATKFVFDECRSLNIELGQLAIDSCINYLRYSIIKALRRKMDITTIRQEILDLACINKRYWMSQLKKGKRPNIDGAVGDFQAWGKCKLVWR